MEKASVPSTSRHQGLYKNNAMQGTASSRRKEVTVELRKKKRNELIQQRRLDHLDTSIQDSELELGADTVKLLTSDVLEEKKNGVVLLVVKMKCNVTPLGPCLLRSHLLSQVIQVFDTDPSSVLHILLNLNRSGMAFASPSSEREIVVSLLSLIRDVSWKDFLEELFFAVFSILERYPTTADLILEEENAELLKGLLETNTDKCVVRQIVWTLCSAVKNGPMAPMSVPLYLILLGFLSFPDDSIRRDVCLLIVVVATRADFASMVVEPSVTSVVDSLGRSSSPSVSSPLLQTLVTLFGEGYEYILQSVEKGLLRILLFSLDHSETAAQALWLIAVIADCPPLQPDLWNEEALLIRVKAILDYGTYDQRKEAVVVVDNMCTCPIPSIHQLAVSCIPSLCDLLTVIDASLVTTVLHAIRSLLERDEHEGVRVTATRIEECGGLDKLEFLQNTHLVDVSVQACEIIDTFFSDEEAESTEDIKDQVDGVIDQVVKGIS